MKKTIVSLLLVMLMIVSVCLVSCNGSAKAKPADELFFNNSGSELLPKLLEDMGFDTSEDSLLSSEKMDKNVKSGVSFEISKLSAGGMNIIEGPMSINASIVANSAETASSGTIEYSYLTDNLKALIAASDGKGGVKIDGVTEKYIDLESLTGLMGGMLPTNTVTSNTVTANPSDLEELEKAILACFDKSKITESKKEITVNSITTKVRAIEYTVTGAEFKTVAEKMVKAVFDSKLIKDAIADSGAEIPEINLDDVKFDDNDKLSVVYYFDVNTYKGSSFEVNMPGEGFEVTFESKEASDKNGDYADLNCNVTVPTDESSTVTQTVAITGNYKNEKGKFEAKLSFDVGSGVKADITLSGEVINEEDAAKRTDMNLSIGSGGMAFNIPVTVTVKESTKEKFDFTIDTAINIPSAAEIAFSMGFKCEQTDETPATVSADDITTADTLGEADLVKLMGKLSKTMELIQNLGGAGSLDGSGDFE